MGSNEEVGYKRVVAQQLNVNGKLIVATFNTRARYTMNTYMYMYTLYYFEAQKKANKAQKKWYYRAKTYQQLCKLPFRQ